MIAAETRKRVRAKAEDRRALILEEAVRLVGERGYYGFTILELAQRSGLSNPGLLHYFPSKEELLIALLEDRDRRGTEIVESVIGLTRHGQTKPELTLRQVLDLFHAMIVGISGEPELMRLYSVLQSEALNPEHPAHAYFMRREADTLESFGGMVASYVSEPRSTARRLVATMEGLAQQWLRSGQGFDIVAEWDRAMADLLPAPEK
jgi:AcrR family transcriptional regulator